VLFTREQEPHVFRPALEVLLIRYTPLIQTHGTYRFTIAVSGDDGEPAWIRLSFTWEGHWDRFDAAIVA